MADMADMAGRADMPAAVEAHLVAHLGEVQARASVTFVGCEPIEVLRFSGAGVGARVGAGAGAGAHGVSSGGVTYATVGMSANPGDGPRCEVTLSLELREDEVYRSLAVIAMTPTVDGLILAEGSTIDLGQPLWPGAEAVGVIVGTPALPALAFAGDEIVVLPLQPITADELDLARLSRQQ